MPPPLLVTLLLDPRTQSRFQAERDAHFPPDRNIVPVHVSLFHHLPAEEEPAIRRTLAEHTSPPFPLSVTALRSLGRGVAYRLASPELAALHRRLSAAFAPWLTAQDRAPFHPHVTIQNKTTPDHARATLAALSAAFAPFDCEARAIVLWRYLGGPWDELATFPFGEAAWS